jgi:hypothetical protein
MLLIGCRQNDGVELGVIDHLKGIPIAPLHAITISNGG